MALATNPKILILDEPTSALDTITQFSVLAAVKSLKKEGRIGGAILISHDISVLAFMVDRVLIMLKGLVVEDAPVKDVVEGPKHPYTQVLSGHLKIDSRKRPAAGIGAPSQTDCCPFADFCPFVMAKCREGIPPLITIEKGHRVACYLYGG
jgi:oligopeptide/dipeptide ABC transporter ATP-binding protein